jgi:hypothetical protein
MASTSILLVLAILSLAPSVTAINLNVNVTDWLDNPGYHNGGTIQEQIQCYALPYGAWGFASHILTYYTVICLAKGISPALPWRELERRNWNVFLGVSGMAFTLPSGSSCCP